MMVCGTGGGSISSTNGIRDVILPPTQVVIEKLAEQIEFSHLAQSLRERINLITDLQNGITQVNSLVVDETNILAQELLALKNDLTGAVAYINEQTQVSIGQRESMVNSINTLMAQYGTSIAALEEQSTVLAEASGALMAEKTVKTDLAGNVSGYGLSAYVDPQGNATSDFQVRADTFSIAPPAVYSATPPAGGFSGKVWIDTSAGNTPKWYNSTSKTWQTTPVKGAVPFIVKTTAETIDGVLIPAGVYMDTAYISKLTADKIDTRGLSIKDVNGNVILSAGSPLDWSDVAGTGKPANNATVGAPAGTYVAGTLAETVKSNAALGASAADAVNNATTGLAAKMSTATRNVLSGGGGLAVGNLTWDAAGNYQSGYGIGITAKGIAAVNSGGATKFVLDNSGNATFAGTLSAATGTFSGSLTASAINAVSTINIGKDSVTIPKYQEAWPNTSHAAGSGWQSLTSVSLTLPAESKVSILMSIVAQNPGGGTNVALQTVISGSSSATVGTISYSTQGQYTEAHHATSSITLAAGTYTFTLQARNDWSGGGPWIATKCSLQVLGAAR